MAVYSIIQENDDKNPITRQVETAGPRVAAGQISTRGRRKQRATGIHDMQDLSENHVTRTRHEQFGRGRDSHQKRRANSANCVSCIAGHEGRVTRHDSARGRHEEARVNQLQTVQREVIMLSSRFCPADISLVVESPGAVFFVACEAMLEACNS